MTRGDMLINIWVSLETWEKIWLSTAIILLIASFLSCVVAKTHYNQNLAASGSKEVDNDSGKQE